MLLRLYDSMVGAKRDFAPIAPNTVKIYGCGPTVYNKPHIGNIRTMLTYDTLVRVLREMYDNVIYVRNITDVDNKIIDAAATEKLSVKEITDKYTKMFHDDMANMFCLAPTVEPRVTEYIPEIIHTITKLLDNNNAYVTDDGIYFDTSTFPEYGKLSKRKPDEQIAGARVAVAENKKNAIDFALWKFFEKDQTSWPSPWGYGRPGWHIECSAMCYKELGTDFDIHCGGEDLKFPHHENEIAQSKCAFPDSNFAHYWLHTAFVMFGDNKMSKSLGNVCYLDDIISNKINFEVVRYALLSTHYRKPLNINAEMLACARDSLDRIYDVLLHHNVTAPTSRGKPEGSFWGAMSDDLNTPAALAEIHKTVTEINSANNDSRRARLINNMINNAKLLGILNYTPEQWFNIDFNDEQINTMIDQRNTARKNKNYAEADRIRIELKNMGIDVMDKEDGDCIWTRKI